MKYLVTKFWYPDRDPNRIAVVWMDLIMLVILNWYLFTPTVMVILALLWFKVSFVINQIYHMEVTFALTQEERYTDHIYFLRPQKIIIAFQKHTCFNIPSAITSQYPRQMCATFKFIEFFLRYRLLVPEEPGCKYNITP